MKIQLVRVAPWWIWRCMLTNRRFPDKRIGIFRNLPGVVPGRWGFFILGFEFGSRNPRDAVGVWLRERGLWPW